MNKQHRNIRPPLAGLALLTCLPLTVSADVFYFVEFIGGHTAHYGPVVCGDDFTFAAASVPVSEPST